MLRPTSLGNIVASNMLPGIEQWSNHGMLLATRNMAKTLLYTRQHCYRQLATLLPTTVAGNNVAWCMVALVYVALKLYFGVFRIHISTLQSFYLFQKQPNFTTKMVNITVLASLL